MLDLRAEALESPSILSGRQSDHALERASKAPGVFVARCNGYLFHCIASEFEQLAAASDAKALVIFARLHARGLDESPQKSACAEARALRELGDGTCGSRIGVQPVLGRDNCFVAVP